MSILVGQRDVGGGRRGRRGQALVETGIVIVLFMVIAIGVVVFGHAMAVANMISHAARDGAQMAATWPSRNVCGGISSYTDLQTQVQRDIAALIGARANNLVVNVFQTPTPPATTPCDRPTTPLISVNVTGCVPFIMTIPIVSGMVGTDCGGQKGFAVNTTMTLLDEGV